jgi:lipopolysaccharide biosynthesis regulator YciM
VGALVLLLAIGIGGLAAGILVGRYYVPDDRALKRSARHAEAYARTINLLLARDRDGAVEQLVEVVGENVDDVEPYFALGALFRARGEWERAIRVHQAIELRTQNDKKLARRARFELGLDFRAAGMPRRATRAMEDCLLEDGKHRGALKALCGLYEEQGRFADAAASWRRLDKLGAAVDRQREHHLLCAAAQVAIERDDTDSAKRFLRDAQRIDESSAHVLIASAELEAARGSWQKAVSKLRDALEARPDLAGYLVGPLRAAELELQAASEVADRESVATRETIDVLRQHEGQHALVSLAAAELQADLDAGTAIESFRQIAADHPDLLPARVFAGRLALQSADPELVRSELEALVGEGGALSWSLGNAWRCQHCGRAADHFFWRCDSCRRWGGARADVGPMPEPTVQPRERRAQPRLATGTLRSLPEPSIDSGLSRGQLAQANSRSSTAGKAGAWIGGAWRALRGSRKGD